MQNAASTHLNLCAAYSALRRYREVRRRAWGARLLRPGNDPPPPQTPSTAPPHALPSIRPWRTLSAPSSCCSATYGALACTFRCAALGDKVVWLEAPLCRFGHSLAPGCLLACTKPQSRTLCCPATRPPPPTHTHPATTGWPGGAPAAAGWRTRRPAHRQLRQRAGNGLPQCRRGARAPGAAARVAGQLYAVSSTAWGGAAPWAGLAPRHPPPPRHPRPTSARVQRCHAGDAVPGRALAAHHLPQPSAQGLPGAAPAPAQAAPPAGARRGRRVGPGGWVIGAQFRTHPARARHRG